MIISLNEVVISEIITEDSNGRKVFRESLSTKEVLINTQNIVAVREVSKDTQQRLHESGFKTKSFSSVLLNKGGVGSAEIIVLETPAEIMNKLNTKGVLHG